jgi:poly(3-hydroxybutyrate) depolymerase
MNFSYVWYDTAHWLLSPARAATDFTKHFFDNPDNPLTNTPYGRTVSAACELFERTTRRYGKPAFDLPTTVIGNEEVAVTEKSVWERPFCRVISFERQGSAETSDRRSDVGPLRHAPARHG